jgi:hypothetical protein
MLISIRDPDLMLLVDTQPLEASARLGRLGEQAYSQELHVRAVA